MPSVCHHGFYLLCGRNYFVNLVKNRTALDDTSKTPKHVPDFIDLLWSISNIPHTSWCSAPSRASSGFQISSQFSLLVCRGWLWEREIKLNLLLLFTPEIPPVLLHIKFGITEVKHFLFVITSLFFGQKEVKLVTVDLKFLINIQPIHWRVVIYENLEKIYKQRKENKIIYNPTTHR